MKKCSDYDWFTIIDLMDPPLMKTFNWVKGVNFH